MPSHFPKIHALAALVSCGVLIAMASPASARNYERCDADGEHCVRIHCNSDGDVCWRQSHYYSTAYYRHEGTWKCDGDSCHFVYNGSRWHPRHWEDLRITPDHINDDMHDRH